MSGPDKKSVDQAVAALLGEPRIPASEWPGELGERTAEAGLYAWYVYGPGSEVLRAGLGHPVRPGLLYAGQTGATKWPSGKLSGTSLHGRIGRNHLNGRVRGSTFRLSLGSVLCWPLALDVAGPKLLSPDSETCLSAWMRRHLAVAVCPVTDRDGLGAVEAEVVRQLDPPFNLGHVARMPVRVRLSELRARVVQGRPRAPSP